MKNEFTMPERIMVTELTPYAGFDFDEYDGYTVGELILGLSKLDEQLVFKINSGYHSDAPMLRTSKERLETDKEYGIRVSKLKSAYNKEMKDIATYHRLKAKYEVSLRTFDVML